MDEEVKDLDNKIKKLKRKINRTKMVSLGVSVIGALMTTIFAISNIFEPAVISFAMTLLTAFFIDLIKRVFILILWKSNKRRNKLIVGEDETG